LVSLLHAFYQIDNVIADCTVQVVREFQVGDIADENCVFSLKWLVASEHLTEDHAQRPHVASLRAHRYIAYLFWREVHLGPCQAAGGTAGARQDLRQPKVGEHQLVGEVGLVAEICLEDDVRRLDVAVDEAMLMDGLEAIQELTRRPHKLLLVCDEEVLIALDELV